jgi:hypothetical protein
MIWLSFTHLVMMRVYATRKLMFQRHALKSYVVLHHVGRRFLFFGMFTEILHHLGRNLVGDEFLNLRDAFGQT